MEFIAPLIVIAFMIGFGIGRSVTKEPSIEEMTARIKRHNFEQRLKRESDNATDMELEK